MQFALTCFLIGFAATAIPLPGKAAVALQSRMLNVKDFGAKCDGSNDDTPAVQRAASSLRSGDTLVFPEKCLMRTPDRKGVAVVFDNLENVSLVGNIMNDEFGEDSPVWRPILDLSLNGRRVTVTTASPHNQRINDVVLIKTACDPALKGAVTIASVLDNKRFTYSTLAGLPPSPACSGGAQWAIPDFERTLFRFTKCKNINLDIAYEAPFLDRSIRHRLGYQVVSFHDRDGEDNIGANIRLRGLGAAYLLAVGSYRSPRLGHLSGARVELTATNCGYPLATWGGCDNSDIRIDAADVHRGLYADGLRQARARVSVRNFDVSGALLTSHEFGAPPTNQVGCSDVFLSVTDTGTDENASYALGPSGRYLAGINTYPSPGVPLFTNIILEAKLIVSDSVGRNIVAMRIAHESPRAIFDDLFLTAQIDRTSVSSTPHAEQSHELFFKSTGEVRDVSFLNWRVHNSPKTKRNPMFGHYVDISEHTGSWQKPNTATDSYLQISVTKARSP